MGLKTCGIGGRSMTPIQNSERLLQGLALVDDQLCAEVDAELARMRAAGERSDPSQFREDGPDPFGIEFAWAGGKLKQNEIQTPPTPVTPQPSPSSLRPRYFAYAGAAVVAALLLIAIGLLIGQRLRDDGRGELAFAARVTAREDPARGPGTVAEVSITNQAARKAYLTIVGLSAGRRPVVHYREEQQFISVPANGSREVKNLPASFDGCAVAVVVLTATPAGEVVRGLTPDPVAPTDVERFRDSLKVMLNDNGYSGVGAEIVRISQ